MRVKEGDVILHSEVWSLPQMVLNNPIHKTSKILMELTYNLYDNNTDIVYTKTINKMLRNKLMVFLFHWEEK